MMISRNKKVFGLPVWTDCRSHTVCYTTGLRPPLGWNNHTEKENVLFREFIARYVVKVWTLLIRFDVFIEFQSKLGSSKTVEEILQRVGRWYGTIQHRDPWWSVTSLLGSEVEAFGARKFLKLIKHVNYLLQRVFVIANGVFLVMDSLRDAPPPWWTKGEVMFEVGAFYISSNSYFNKTIEKIMNDLQTNEPEFNTTKFLQNLNETYQIYDTE